MDTKLKQIRIGGIFRLAGGIYRLEGQTQQGYEVLKIKLITGGRGKTVDIDEDNQKVYTFSGLSVVLPQSRDDFVNNIDDEGGGI